MAAEIITWICITILSLIGLTVIVRAVSYAIICRRGYFNGKYMILLYGNDADIQLRTAIECVIYKGLPECPECHECNASEPQIIAVDCGLCGDMQRLCEIICNDCNIELCSLDSLTDTLKSHL